MLLVMVMTGQPQRARLFEFFHFFLLLHFDLLVLKILSSMVLGDFQSGEQCAEWAI